MLIPLAAAGLLALCYGFFLSHRGESWLRSGVKVASTAILALVAVAEGSPWLLVAGLALGAAGDFFLTREGEPNFLAGLGSFLLGHLAYVALFAAQAVGPGLFLSIPWRLTLAAFLLVLTALTYRQLWPHLGVLRLPVAAYVVTICAMGLAALSLPLAWPLGLAVAGAFLFILSDLLLSQQLFIIEAGTRASRALGLALWLTYWPAQALILAAFIV